ncbi:MAG: tryptophan--tRNA ligase [Gammaproteobacteria bacterium]|nr:tryptophan--tRNA ligase [Gammaproteobacteria bacterium]
MSLIKNNRVVSGMRPTGALHLGNYHGALKNWIDLQHKYDCFYFVADWHALTTHYDDPAEVERNTWEMVTDWLAAGLNPKSSTIFVQSQVLQHAELHLLLSMITPLGWVERVPTYKDQIEKLKERDLATYGFLGYPVLQSADILLYRPAHVPVGEDQVAHVEITRELARRFNHLYGREPGFEEKIDKALKSLGKSHAKKYKAIRRAYQEKGSLESLEEGRKLIQASGNLTIADRERLLGNLEGSGRIILVEPQALLTPVPKMPGLDGQKMSKSYGNTIALREDPDEVSKKIKVMPTDPARVRRTDPGNPEKCPVWDFHKIYSDESTQNWVREGCTTAGIGCIDCKMKVIEPIQAELEPIRSRGQELERHPDQVRAVIRDGNEAAREAANETMTDVRKAVGLQYSEL